MKDFAGWAWVAAVVLLCAATLAVHRPGWRYEPLDAGAEDVDLLPDSPSREARWEIRAPAGDVLFQNSRLVLENDTQKNSPRARVEVEIPPKVMAVRLSARIATDSVEASGGRNPGAAVYVADRMPDGRLAFGQHHDLARLQGTRPPVNFDDIFAVQPQARSVVIGVHLVSVTGHMTVDELRLTLLADAARFVVARRLLTVAWGALALWGAALFIARAARRRLALAAVGMVAMGGVLFLIPHGARLTLLSSLSAVAAGSIGVESMGDVGHVLIFVMVGLVAAIAAPYARLPTLIVPLVALAVSCEVMQLMTDERSVEVNDALRNASGVLAGFAIGVLLHIAARVLRPESPPGNRPMARDERGAPSRA